MFGPSSVMHANGTQKAHLGSVVNWGTRGIELTFAAFNDWSSTFPKFGQSCGQKTHRPGAPWMLEELTEKSFKQVTLENPHNSLNGSFKLLLLRPPQFSAVVVQEPQGSSCVCSSRAEETIMGDGIMFFSFLKGFSHELMCALRHCAMYECCRSTLSPDVSWWDGTEWNRTHPFSW